MAVWKEQGCPLLGILLLCRYDRGRPEASALCNRIVSAPVSALGQVNPGGRGGEARSPPTGLPMTRVVYDLCGWVAQKSSEPGLPQNSPVPRSSVNRRFAGPPCFLPL